MSASGEDEGGGYIVSSSVFILLDEPDVPGFIVLHLGDGEGCGKQLPAIRHRKRPVRNQLPERPDIKTGF